LGEGEGRQVAQTMCPCRSSARGKACAEGYEGIEAPRPLEPGQRKRKRKSKRKRKRKSKRKRKRKKGSRIRRKYSAIGPSPSV